MPGHLPALDDLVDGSSGLENTETLRSARPFGQTNFRVGTLTLIRNRSNQVSFVCSNHCFCTASIALYSNQHTNPGQMSTWSAHRIRLHLPPTASIRVSFLLCFKLMCIWQRFFKTPPPAVCRVRIALFARACFCFGFRTRRSHLLSVTLRSFCQPFKKRFLIVLSRSGILLRRFLFSKVSPALLRAVLKMTVAHSRGS